MAAQVLETGCLQLDKLVQEQIASMSASSGLGSFEAALVSAFPLRTIIKVRNLGRYRKVPAGSAPSKSEQLGNEFLLSRLISSIYLSP